MYPVARLIPIWWPIVPAAPALVTLLMKREFLLANWSGSASGKSVSWKSWQLAWEMFRNPHSHTGGPQRTSGCHQPLMPQVKILHRSESEPGLTQAVDSDSEYWWHLASVGHVSISEGFSQHRKSLNAGSGPGWVCQLSFSNQDKGSLPPYPRPKNLPLSKRSQILWVCLYLPEPELNSVQTYFLGVSKGFYFGMGYVAVTADLSRLSGRCETLEHLSGGISPATFPARTAKSGTEAHGG